MKKLLILIALISSTMLFADERDRGRISVPFGSGILYSLKHTPETDAKAAKICSCGAQGCRKASAELAK